LAEGAALSDRWQRPGVLKEADAFVTRVHAEAVETFLESERIDKTGITIDFRDTPRIIDKTPMPPRM
jgi:anhydro-N-acetylmuramic acid kinase